LPPCLIGGGFRYFLTSLGGAPDLLTCELAGLIPHEIAGLAEILGLSLRRWKGSGNCGADCEANGANSQGLRSEEIAEIVAEVVNEAAGPIRQIVCIIGSRPNEPLSGTRDTACYLFTAIAGESGSILRRLLELFRWARVPS
jgi:hypothetical protein